MPEIAGRSSDDREERRTHIEHDVIKNDGSLSYVRLKSLTFLFVRSHLTVCLFACRITRAVASK